MTAEQIVEELKALGSESYKKVMRNHGVPEPFFGVKIGDMKKIQKRVKKDYQLSLALYDTGIYDAMYLAGLIADDLKMTKKDLNGWLKKAHCAMIVEYTVPWVASESRYGNELALKWIEAKDEKTASAGWATLCSLLSIKPDHELDIPLLKSLLKRVEKEIHKHPNRVRLWMNAFVIAAGSFVKDLTDAAIHTAEKVGTVIVDMGDTACKVPDAVDYIQKVHDHGSIGKKRKSAKC